MPADHFGKRYIPQEEFIEYARELGLGDSSLVHVIEFAERFCIVTPAARVRFPDPVVRRWFLDRHPHEHILEPIEPDSDQLSAANALMNVLAHDRMRRPELPGDGEHPLDVIPANYRPFISKDFSRSNFESWSAFRTPISLRDGSTIGNSDSVSTYYHAWQVFQLAAYLRSGLSVLYDVASESTWGTLPDLRSGDVRVTANITACAELKALNENINLFNTVAQFDDRRNRALQTHARDIDRQTGRLFISAARAYRSREAEIARQVVSRAELSPSRLIAFIQFQCRAWVEAHSRHPSAVVDAYKRHIQSTIELLRFAKRRITASSLIKRVGTFDRSEQSLLRMIFPDWVSEQRNFVAASLGQWIVPRLSQMPPQYTFTTTEVADFCNWIERKGLLQFYWHCRRLTDIGPFDDEIGRAATAVEVIGLSSLVEQLTNQVLSTRRPPPNMRSTLMPKLHELLGPTSTLTVELKKKKHCELTQTTKRTLRRQLMRIDRMHPIGTETPVLKSLLRLVLIRNAVIHTGLHGFRRDQMQTLVEALLIAALIVWKRRLDPVRDNP